MHYVQQAWINLLAAKLRTLLAILGILVGTAAVVALLSCGRLATEKALEQFKALGTDSLAISLYFKEPSGSHASDSPMTAQRWQKWAEKVPDVLMVAPYTMAYPSLSFQGKPVEGVVVGADERLADVLNIELSTGHFVSFVGAFEHFCVIGDGIAQQLKQVSLDGPVGKQIRIDQALYTIIGVAKPWKENAFFNENVNRTVMIPLASVPLVDRHAKVHDAIFRLKPKTKIDPLLEQMNQIVDEQASGLGVFVRSAKQIIASMESQGRVFTLLLAVIGGISLLVGGIGVMNVMLVSVSERRKEIGIRKAVGATCRAIECLFLMEAVMLTLIGGGIGIILGVLLTWGIAWFSEWPFQLVVFPLWIGGGISVATGLFFGFYPARRAAALDPVVSLRDGV